jgi:hypothetical protein
MQKRFYKYYYTHKMIQKQNTLFGVLLINMAVLARPLYVTCIEAQRSQILGITRYRKFSPSRGICIYIKRHFNRQTRKDKNTLWPTQLQFSLKHWNIYLSKSKTKKQFNKRTYSLGVLVFAPHCFETASKPISFNFLKSLKT